MHYQINIGEKIYRLDLQKEPEQPNRWRCRLQGREIVFDMVQLAADSASIVIEGRSFQARRENGFDTQRIFVRDKPYEVSVQDARSLRNRRRAAAGNAGLLKLTASMPGKVIRVLTNKGDAIQAGAGIVVIEAMKMQNELRSPKDGTIKELLAREGMTVNTGDVLAVLE